MKEFVAFPSDEAKARYQADFIEEQEDPEQFRKALIFLGGSP